MFRSAAGDRVAIADALRQSRLAPALAGVARAEHLSRFRHGINLRRIARMRRHAHHRVVRLDAAVETLPAPADILALIDRAVGATERRRERRIQHLRVVRRNAQIAAIAHRRIPADLDILPMRAAVVAAESPMRFARKTVPGAAALHASACPSSIPSISVWLTMRLLYFSCSAKRRTSVVQSSQLSPRSRLRIAPFASMQP